MDRLLVTLLLGVAALRGTRAQVVENASITGVFKTTVFMALEWATADFVREPEYNTDDVFQIETGASTYFSEILDDSTVSAFHVPNKFVDASVNVRRQRLTNDGSNVVIETTVSVYHFGNTGIADLADLLRFVTNKNTTGSEEFLALNSLIGMGVKVGSVSFTNAKSSVPLAASFASETPPVVNADDDKTLVVVTTILAFALFGLSAILIWMAGGWMSLRNQLKAMIRKEDEELRSRVTREIQQKPTEDTQDEETSPDKEVATHLTSPPGVMGMNSFNPYGNPATGLEGFGVRTTPPRTRASDIESEVATPMSEYSDSGRAPIGITSMRKLLANRVSQEEMNADLYGMKKLEFDD